MPPRRHERKVVLIATVHLVRTYDDDVRLAHVVADAADAATLPRFTARDLHVELKADSTPVTDADRAAEQAVRNVLRRARPRDAVLGEEYGLEAPAVDGRSAAAEPGGRVPLNAAGLPAAGGTRCWVVDPIDGTKSYMRGVPVWGTLLALLDGPDVVAAVVSAPALNRRWWAGRGSGAWTGRSLSSASPCRVSGVTALEEASLSYGSLMAWEEAGTLDPFLRLARRCWRSRSYGDFWSYMLLAEGGVDIATEPEVALHDLAAVSLIVEEAGGRFSDLSGGRGPAGGSALATNGPLHDMALGILGRPHIRSAEAPP